MADAVNEEADVFSDTLGEYVDFAFGDLVSLTIENEDKDIFNRLYQGRTSELGVFSFFIQSAKESSHNMLILGEAGVGKTNFVYKLLWDNEALDKDNIHSIIIDYRRIPGGDTQIVLKEFCEKMDEYFTKIQNNIEPLKHNIENVKDNIHVIFKKLQGLKRNECSHHLILYLDDLDYADETWVELLKYFLPFAESNKCSLILSLRPELYAAIESIDSRFNEFYVRRPTKIELKAIDVETIITSRLAPVIEQNMSSKLHSFLNFSGLFNRKSHPLWKLAKSYGIESLDDLKSFVYPMTNRHNIFMSLIANGNFREIFPMAYETLKFIAENKKNLETVLDDEGNIRYKIGRENFLKIFYDNDKSSYKIININEHKSTTGNSRYFNTLEAIKLNGKTDEKFYTILSTYGHKRNEIKQAVMFLEHELNRFIKPKKLYPQSQKHILQPYNEFDLTSKGDVYLRMATQWHEYIKRVGDVGESISSL